MTDAAHAAEQGEPLPEPDLPHPLTAEAARVLSARVAATGLALDEAQRQAVAALAADHTGGVYLWGPVGRGKTVLAEQYVAALPTEKVRRFHFFTFFRELHQQIAAEWAPLPRVIERMLGDADAVFFDEFHVHDVADGIYLTALLRVLRERRILLVATSNYAPDALMPHPGDHREFLEAIGILADRLTVIPLGDGTDYRDGVAVGGTGFASGTWRVAAPGDPAEAPTVLVAEGIEIPVIADDTSGVTVTFEALCDDAVGHLQYLWLADHTVRVHVCEVPDLATVGAEPLQRFTILVDVFSDRDVRLDVTSVAGFARIRDAARPPVDAARTVSRLAQLRRP